MITNKDIKNCIKEYFKDSDTFKLKFINVSQYNGNDNGYYKVFMTYGLYGREFNTVELTYFKDKVFRINGAVLSYMLNDLGHKLAVLFAEVK